MGAAPLVMLDSVTARELITPRMPVVGHEDRLVGTVDRIEGTDLIKLARDADGVHHYIPLIWVSSVDDKVHIDRPAAEITREWTTTPNT
jgi:hypothetical protein